jgi:hypothetical protein
MAFTLHAFLAAVPVCAERRVPGFLQSMAVAGDLRNFAGDRLLPHPSASRHQ